MVEWLVEAHDSGLGVLEEAAMTYFKENVAVFEARSVLFVVVVPCCVSLL